MSDSPKRKKLSKKLRFEVFKRDSFTCQYCARKAPDVILHLDHIKPVVDGGSNDILNLLTACVDCNLGKGRVPLDDSTVVEKKRRQTEESQAKREQLEMLVEWQESLRGIQEEAVRRAHERWEDVAPGWSLTDTSKRRLSALVRKFGIMDVLEAMDIAGDQYIRTDSGGNATQESSEEAWSKVGGICNGLRLEREDPQRAVHVHMRAMLRKRLGRWEGAGLDVVASLGEAAACGGTEAELWSLVRRAATWGEFENATWEFTHEEEPEAGVSEPPDLCLPYCAVCACRLHMEDGFLAAHTRRSWEAWALTHEDEHAVSWREEEAVGGNHVWVWTHAECGVEGLYSIPLRRLNTPARMLAWVIHLSEKNWFEVQPFGVQILRAFPEALSLPEL